MARRAVQTRSRPSPKNRRRPTKSPPLIAPSPRQHFAASSTKSQPQPPLPKISPPQISSSPAAPGSPKLFPALLGQSHLHLPPGNFLLRHSPRRSTLPTPRPAHLAHPARRILRHARSRIPRPKSRQRSPRPRRRSRHAIAHRHPRSRRRRTRIPRPPFPRAEKFAGRRNARLPIRKHLERRFSDRSASGLRKCLAGRRRFRSRFQTRSIGRRIRHNANPASRRAQPRIDTARSRTTRAPLLARHKRIRTTPRSSAELY